MLKQTFLSVVLVGALCVGATSLSNRALAISNTQFFCDTSGSTPTTVYQTSRGKVQLIRWFNAGLDSSVLQRCQVVSERFQQAHQQGLLRFLTTGRLNGANVICAVPEKGKSCEQGVLLWALPSGRDPTQVLQNLSNTSGVVLQPDEWVPNSRLYLNVEEALGNRLSQQATPPTNEGRAMDDYNINNVRITSPNDAQGYYNRANARVKIGDKPGAIADYQKAAELAKAQDNKQLYEAASKALEELRR